MEVIAHEEAAARAGQQAGPNDMGDIDTDDDDVDAEYAAWKQRELARIKRDRAEREAAEKEAEERERLKNMTEEERAEWERKNPKVSGFCMGCNGWLASTWGSEPGRGS